MSRPVVAAILIAVLAACFGASLANRTGAGPGAGQDAVARRPDGSPHQRIDKTRPVPLEPRRLPPDFGERVMDHVRAITAFGPRNPAPADRVPPGWSKQIAYILTQLRALGLDPQRDTWTDRRELITFTNVTAVIPGRRSERILLGCHHDTKCTRDHPDEAHNFWFVGANDGASGVAMLIELARVLLQEQHEATYQLVFFDGEESLDWEWNEGARALFGSRRFVKRHREAELAGQEGRIAALVLLDMVGRTDLHIQEELYSTPELRHLAWSAAVATGHQEHFFRRAEAASDDHKPFLDVGIPAVDLIDLNGNPHWHKPTDTVENMSARSLQAVGEVVVTMLPAVERRYVVEGR